MKTTIELGDALFDEVKALARADRRTVRSIFEEALRRYLDDAPKRSEPFVLPDVSYGSGWLATEVASRSLHELVVSTHDERAAGLAR